MIKELIDILNSKEQIVYWSILQDKTNSCELFFIKHELDMNREVSHNNCNVKIYTKELQGKKEKIGSTSFNILPSMSKEEIDEKINEQIELCKFTLNNPFEFPKKSIIKPLLHDIGFDGHSLKEAAFIVADDLFEADVYQNGYINSTEIFMNYHEKNFFDKSGNEFSYSNNYGNVEFVTTWKEENFEIELYKFLKFDSLDDTYIKQEANRMLLQAADRHKAQKTPELDDNFKLVLSGENVKKYFEHFVYKTNTDTIYSHASDFDIGTRIQLEDSAADKISIKLEPLMKKSTVGAPFDSEGIVLRRTGIIEKGEVVGLWGTNAKSQYISKPVRGCPKNVDVAPGTLTNEELEEESYIDVVSFSDFIINEVTGDFGSEIRLGYIHQKNNKEPLIVTGGSVSGNIYDSINEVRFSKEREQSDNYFCPKKIILPKVVFNKGN